MRSPSGARFGVTGALLVTVLGLTAGVGSAPATGQTAGSAAGSYKGTFFFIGGKTIRHRAMQLVSTSANGGTFTVSGGGPAGDWTQHGENLVLKGTADKTTFGFRIAQDGSDLGSNTHRGTISVFGNRVGSWYAVAAS